MPSDQRTANVVQCVKLRNFLNTYVFIVGVNILEFVTF